MRNLRLWAARFGSLDLNVGMFQVRSCAREISLLLPAKLNMGRKYATRTIADLNLECRV